MEARQSAPTCPVCKSAIEKDKLIPLYGRGGKQHDPRTKIPPRPQGQREEVPQTGNFSVGWYLDCHCWCGGVTVTSILPAGWLTVLFWTWPGTTNWNGKPGSHSFGTSIDECPFHPNSLFSHFRQVAWTGILSNVRHTHLSCLTLWMFGLCTQVQHVLTIGLNWSGSSKAWLAYCSHWQFSS